MSHLATEIAMACGDWYAFFMPKEDMMKGHQMRWTGCKSQDFAGEISTHIWDGKGLNRELPERE
jgi:hypothetical protein